MNKIEIIQLPKIEDPRGNLSIIEQFKNIPFEIKRVHWIYDVPGGMDRGGHAYKLTDEFIVALSGSFDVEIDDGVEKSVFPLNRSYYGLFVPKGLWRCMTNFSTNSLALVLSSYELNKFHYPEGNLTYVYQNVHVPFSINRVFYSYDIPGGESRGAHAHRHCHQFIVAASGSFEVALDDGVNKRTVLLNRPYYGLHVPPGIWAAEQGFSSGSICLVLASEGYQENDYIRDYDEFLKYIEEQKK